MVRRVVDTKTVACAGGVHQRLDRRQIGSRAGAHGDALALGQADVVAPFLLHARQDRLVVAGQVDVDGAERLDALRAALEPGGEQRRGHFRRVGQLRLDLEDADVPLQARLAQHHEQRARHIRGCPNPPPARAGRRPACRPTAAAAEARSNRRAAALSAQGRLGTARRAIPSRMRISAAPTGWFAGCGRSDARRRRRPTRFRRG